MPAAKIDWCASAPENGLLLTQFQPSESLPDTAAPAGTASSTQTTSELEVITCANDALLDVVLLASPL
jgi:hypothetical protein